MRRQQWVICVCRHDIKAHKMATGYGECFGYIWIDGQRLEPCPCAKFNESRRQERQSRTRRRRSVPGYRDTVRSGPRAA